MFPFFPTFGRASAQVEYVDERDSGIGAVSSYDFGTMPLGRANSTKRNYVVITWNSNTTRTVSGVTIGGVAAVLVHRASATATRSGVDIYQADVAAASGNVVVTWSGALSGGAYCGVYAAYNLTSGAVYFSDLFYTTGSVSSMTNAVNTVAGGSFLLTGARLGGGTVTMALTNAVEDTSTATQSDCQGHDFAPPTATGRVITCTLGASSSQFNAMATVVIRL